MSGSYIFSFLFLVSLGCSFQKEKADTDNSVVSIESSDTLLPVVDPTGQIVLKRINPPQGFKRTDLPDSSFGSYLRHLPLKEHGSLVLLFNGLKKNRQDVHIAVVDMDVGDRDLQQCADAIMRLRGEYLYQAGRYDQIRFHFTNGFLAEYK